MNKVKYKCEKCGGVFYLPIGVPQDIIHFTHENTICDGSLTEENEDE